MAIKKKTVIFILVYVVFFFFFLEGASRVLISFDPFFKYIKGDDDSSWRIEWIKRHKYQEGLSYVQEIYHPLRGWALKPNLKDMRIDGGVILNTNSKGIRGHAEYTYKKPQNIQRILILGDSFTFGTGVNDTETYSYYLQTMLPETEVINCGVHGYGHDQMLIYLKDEGIKYNADIILLGFIAADMERNLLSFFSYAKPRFAVVDNKLVLENSPVPPPDTFMKKGRFELKFFDLLYLCYQKCLWRFGLNIWKMETLTTAILDDMVATIKHSGAVPVFVYLPVVSELLHKDSMTPEESYLLRYCEEHGIHCLSLRQQFAESIQKSSLFNKNILRHYDAGEQLLVAQGIKKYLLDRHLCSFRNKS